MWLEALGKRFPAFLEKTGRGLVGDWAITDDLNMKSRCNIV